MTLLKRLQSELKSLIDMEYPFSGVDFPVNEQLEDGESVTLFSSDFEDGLLENIYCVEEKDGTISFISSSHSDGGIVVFQGMPK
jgi:hypothetical protein